MSATLNSLHIYPMKSARGIALRSATLRPWGLEGDRRWMAVDENGRFLSQREHAALATVQAQHTASGIRLSAPGREPLEVPTPAADTLRTVTLWRDQVQVVPGGDIAAEWLSAVLELPAQLVHLDDPATRRQVDQEFGRAEDHVSFADGYPVLITTTSSLAALNELIAAGTVPSDGPLPMERFRPSLVVDGSDAWAEDDWHRIRVGSTVLQIVKPCGRCVVTTTDQQTGIRGREPLLSLARHRKFGTRLVFGQNAVVERPGTLQLGDPVTVLA